MKISLKRILKKELSLIIKGLEPYVLIQDVYGNVLCGDIDEVPINKYPIELQGELMGWVSGKEKVPVIASLLSYVAKIELEKRALGRETLDKYKEITLLYEISENLVANLAPPRKLPG